MRFLEHTSKYNYETIKGRREIVKDKFEIYYLYLKENQSKFPKSAYDFAFADWHYNPQDPKSPHDAWIESVNIFEIRSPEARKSEGIGINICLLNASHNGQIKITYKNIKSYSLNLTSNLYEKNTHGDWLLDELYLSENDNVIHEIELLMNGNWKIECEDIIYNWLPFFQ